MRHLITGGAGFIGSHLADALVARGDDVVLVDNFDGGSERNVAHLLDSPRVQLVRGSAEDPHLMWGLAAYADTCFHLASALGVRRVVDWPLDSLLANVRGADVVAGCCVANHCRLLFASTSEVYGKPQPGALEEGADRVYGAATVSRWTYATAKTFGEQLVYGYARERGAEALVVRFFNVCGPRQVDMVLPELVGRALAGEDLVVHGDGRQTRCFCHVLDAVEAVIRLMDDDRTNGSVFNVGNPEEITVNELAEKVVHHTGSKSRIVHAHPDYGPGFEEIRRRKPSIDAIRNLVGWQPRRTIDDAILEVIAYHAGVLT